MGDRFLRNRRYWQQRRVLYPYQTTVERGLVRPEEIEKIFGVQVLAVPVREGVLYGFVNPTALALFEAHVAKLRSR